MNALDSTNVQRNTDILRGRSGTFRVRSHDRVKRPRPHLSACFIHKAGVDISAHPASRAVYLNGGIAPRIAGFTKTIW